MFRKYSILLFFQELKGIHFCSRLKNIINLNINLLLIKIKYFLKMYYKIFVKLNSWKISDNYNNSISYTKINNKITIKYLKSN